MGNRILHLAIPCLNLVATEEFYISKLGCLLGRKHEDRIIVNFFGEQLVCHMVTATQIDVNPTMYPRHFGIILTDPQEFENIYKRVLQQEVKIFQEKFVRYAGMQEEHSTFFCQDPSNNLIEFKYYKSHEMIY